MKRLMIPLLLASSVVSAATVRIESDVSTQTPKPTICKIFIDNQGTDTPVVAEGNGVKCLWTSGPLQPGNHTAKARFALVNSQGVRKESVDSAVANFTIAPPEIVITAPTGLRTTIIP